MVKVLIDHNMTGQARWLWDAVTEAGWAQMVALTFVYFSEVGLPYDSSDREVWRFMQTHGMFLLTANRNDDDDDSLERTMREENNANAWPVITIGNPDRLVERSYREECVSSLLNIVLYPENFFGTGRQYIP